jgi:RNA polymerase sigma factor (sigma-70 family)
VSDGHSEKMSQPEDPAAIGADSSIDVLARARTGDVPAAYVLLERTVGPLKQWARRRLPDYARASANTDDVVQDVVVRALGRIERFEHQTVEALQAYLRESVRNRIRDEIRLVTRRGVAEEIPETLTDGSYSPLEQLILRERSERYLAALRTLKPEDRMAVIFRLEHRWPFQVIADKLGKSSPDAARMAVARAVKKLAEALGVTDSTASGEAGRDGADPAKTSAG